MIPTISGPGVRAGDQFEFILKPSRKSASTFAAITPTGVIVTNRATDLWELPDYTPVLAHWHGHWRTDGFAMTVGLLKAKAAAFGVRVPFE